jgi:hypothetical protein
MECSTFTEWGEQRVNVLSAESVAATGEVPGHCKVSGTIDKQIGFELLLPDEWNSKFVMSGGGGFVGTTTNTLQLRPLPGVPTPLDEATRRCRRTPDTKLESSTQAGPSTRPLCPYPLAARWDGSGDPDNAASFECVEPD